MKYTTVMLRGRLRASYLSQYYIVKEMLRGSCEFPSLTYCSSTVHIHNSYNSRKSTALLDNSMCEVWTTAITMNKYEEHIRQLKEIHIIIHLRRRSLEAKSCSCQQVNRKCAGGCRGCPVSKTFCQKDLLLLRIFIANMQHANHICVSLALGEAIILCCLSSDRG